MAMHVFSYRLKCLLRDKELLFWTLVFPILLGALFYFGFGNLMGSDGTGGFEPIRAAVVENQYYDTNVPFRTMLKALSDPGTERLLILTVTPDPAEAGRMLAEGEVAGVISVGPENSVSLEVAGSGLPQSLLKAVLEEYVHTSATVMSIAGQNPFAMFELLTAVGERVAHTREVSFGNRMPDWSMPYFYALIAMACLYSGFWGMRNSTEVQADQSAHGARRSVAPTHKMLVVMCDWAAGLVVAFGEMLVLLAYIMLVLRVDIGDQLGYVILTTLAGCFAGVSLGTLIGTMFHKSESMKVGVLIGTSMAMSFLAGLMFSVMKDIVARNVPVLSYINPAALISDAFYSLYVFDNHRRFFLNIGILVAISAVMCIVSYLQLRRERYASL
jgi:ABC-2 type transport system permease protein